MASVIAIRVRLLTRITERPHRDKSNEKRERERDHRNQGVARASEENENDEDDEERRQWRASPEHRQTEFTIDLRPIESRESDESSPAIRAASAAKDRVTDRATSTALAPA